MLEEVIQDLIIDVIQDIISGGSDSGTQQLLNVAASLRIAINEEFPGAVENG